MFTGIIQEVGSVYEANSIGGGVRLTIEAPMSASEVDVNDSIAVNGVCQTVVGKKGNRFTVVAVEETLLKTTLGSLRPSRRVNLELSLRLADRLGGHIVSGHVDCVGEVDSIIERGTSWLFRIQIPPQFRNYVIPVGSIAIDGVSLTVAIVEGNTITASVIPHTMQNTIFSEYKARTRVNIEFDMIGKYVEKLMGTRKSGESTDTVSVDQLKAWGYNV